MADKENLEVIQTYRSTLRQVAELAGLVSLTGLSKSELTRRAIDELYEKLTKIADEAEQDN